MRQTYETQIAQLKKQIEESAAAIPRNPTPNLGESSNAGVSITLSSPQLDELKKENAELRGLVKTLNARINELERETKANGLKDLVGEVAEKANNESRDPQKDPERNKILGQLVETAIVRANSKDANQIDQLQDTVIDSAKQEIKTDNE